MKITLRFPVWKLSFDFVIAYLENEMNFLTSMSWEEISRFEKVDGDIYYKENLDRFVSSLY